MVSAETGVGERSIDGHQYRFRKASVWFLLEVGTVLPPVVRVPFRSAFPYRF